MPTAFVRLEVSSPLRANKDDRNSIWHGARSRFWNAIFTAITVQSGFLTKWSKVFDLKPFGSCHFIAASLHRSERAMVKLRKSRITLLALIGYIGLSLEGLVFVAPFLHLPNGHILRTKIHPDASQEILRKFMDNLPFRSMTYHTVSSGENLVCLIPTSGDQFRMSSSPGHGLRARSSSKAGTLFIRHDQMCVLTYGYSRDHGSFMPPVLYVVEEDLPALLAFGEKAKHCQLEQETKEPLTLTFTCDVQGMSQGMVGMVGDGGLFNVETGKIGKTGNKKVDEVLALIRAKTQEHWLVPPKEVVRLLTTGDANGMEGTDGYLFPPMVIGNGVLMEFGNYAHSGPINILVNAPHHSCL